MRNHEQDLKALQVLESPESYPSLTERPFARTLLRIWRYPSFEPYSSWALIQASSQVFLRRVTWDKSDVYGKHRSLIKMSLHLIYSPNVPWFRTRSRDDPHTLFLASVITAPAPNAGVVLSREPDALTKIEAALRRRAGLVLAVAAANGHRTILLGAWGCGVFRNDPALVADAFGYWLESDKFAGAFDRAVFAIFDRSKDRATLAAFKQRFTGVE